MQIKANSPTVKRNVLAAAEAIKKAVDASSLGAAEKAQVKQVVDSTEFQAKDIPNTTVYQLAVGALALAAGIIVIGGVLLAFQDGRQMPEFLQVTLATIVGALAGMIIPTSRSGE
ncbi:MAG: hypothetical protein AAGF23_03140 [Acidobacteriota bacterium]